MKNIIKISALFLGLTFLLLTSACSDNGNSRKEGLIGIYYSEPDLTSIKGISVLKSLNQKWDESVDYEGGTSGVWNGYIVAPFTGKINFHLSTNKSLFLKINNSDSVKANNTKTAKVFSLKMKKGNAYPINIVFLNPGKHEEVGWFNIQWSWKAHNKSEISLKNFFYTKAEEEKLNFLNDANKGSIDSSKVIFAKGKNVIIYYKRGRFGGWPANNGIWNWGNEILVGFTLAYNKENKYHHAINMHKPIKTALARSTDGGETWKLVDTTSFRHRSKFAKLNRRRINFETPGFALRNTNNIFYYSYDKGKSWKGPFRYPDLGVGKFTARTDYLVTNRNECMIFTSAKDNKVRASLQDKAMCIKTDDGGLTFKFVSWMTENDSIRSVMPATVRIDKNHLLSAMRRRLDPPKNNKYVLPKNWIDVYESTDNGKSWHFLHKIGNTDTGLRNGNPPSMVRLRSGLICVVYGYRAKPYGIRARITSDNGKTWSKEIILRDDARTWDIGYCRSVVRNDDKVVSVYYYSTKEKPERHIEATIWDPNSIEMKR